LDGMMSSLPNNAQDDYVPLIVTPDVWGPPPTSLKDEVNQELQLNVLSRYPVNYVLPPLTTMVPSPLPPSSRPLPPPPAFVKSTSDGSASSGGSSSSRKRHMDVQDDNKTYASLMERRHLAESTEREKRVRAFGYSNGITVSSLTLSVLASLELRDKGLVARTESCRMDSTVPTRYTMKSGSFKFSIAKTRIPTRFVWNGGFGTWLRNT
jgi:hypothetical protein